MNAIDNGKLDGKSLALGALVGAGLVLTIAAATGSSQRTTYEYKIVPASVYQGLMEKAVNELAADQWDLLSVAHGEGQYAVAVLRREKK